MGEILGYVEMFWPFLVLIGVFYFLMYRPQKKQEAERRRFLISLKKGDKVVTAGGIHGVIKSLTDSTVILEIAPKVTIKVDKAAITRGDVKLVSEEAAKAADAKKDDEEEEVEYVEEIQYVEEPETDEKDKKEESKEEKK